MAGNHDRSNYSDTAVNKAAVHEVPRGSYSAPSSLSFDGPSEDVEHPNLASFKFSFAPSSPEPSKEATPESLEAPEQKGSKSKSYLHTPATSTKRSSTQFFEQFACGSELSAREGPQNNLPSPSFGAASSPFQSSQDAPKSTTFPAESLIERNAPPNNSKTSELKSVRRFVRPDDWWLKRKAHTADTDVQGSEAFLLRRPAKKCSLDPPQSSSSFSLTSSQTPKPQKYFRKSPSPRDPPVPAPLRHKTVNTKKSQESLPKFEPLEPGVASARSDAYFQLSGSRSFFALSDPFRNQELEPEDPGEKTPRITRELILKYIPESQPEEVYFAESLRMSMLHPESATAMTEHRREAVRLAQTQEKSVVEKCKRAGQDAPDYGFDELIGKGSFGRVYKGRQISTKKVVAIKVLDIDEADFHAFGEAKDEQIRDFNREIRILRQAQESGAPNMNQIIEAFPVHSQLWLICDYCPGGSVKTLMRATNDRLAEKYIVVVGRELAKALKGLHDAGIMHRDVKAANVLIHEEGRLQLCDFGVAGVLEQRTDKRRTFIGTLHWMPPELWSDEPEYSDEVDVWEFGVTLYECAIGKPPNADLRERQQLKSRMRRLKQSLALPEHENFTEGLRSLVKYTLSPEASTRPSMKDVLEHEYVRDTEETHPTKILVDLVQVYYQWLHGGGQRASLFMPGGAVVTDISEDMIEPTDEWNFSTTDGFDKRISALLEIPNLAELSPTGQNDGEETPKAPKAIALSPPPLREMTNVQRQNFEARVQRGADLSNLFDQDMPTYEYKVKRDFVPIVEQRRVSDLPFRAMVDDRPTSIASSVIDLGDFDSQDYAIAAPREETIQLADAATIRAKRADSKGPRDPSESNNLTARRTSSSQDLHSQKVGARDFAFPPKEWAMSQNYEGDLRGPESGMDKTPVRDTGRQTMDWTFATAIPMSPEQEQEDSPQASQSSVDRSKKHATLDWSFSNAMAEAEESSTQDQTPPPIRATPGRPGHLMRTMTQPVTLTEVHHAADFPRPSTSHSEAFSESSFSSADVDPFALETDQEYPDPAAMDDMNISSGYHTRGRSLAPEHAMEYATTIAGPAPYMLGQPARIGEEGFPGPTQPNSAIKIEDKKGKANKKSTSSSSSAGRPKVEMPAAVPPSEASMAGNASAEVVGKEVSRLLGGFQQGLHAASQALGIMRRPRRKGKGKVEESEWEDEE